MNRVFPFAAGGLVLLGCLWSSPPLKPYEELAQKNPYDPKVHYQLAELYLKKSIIDKSTFEKNYLNKALLEYKKVLEITPDNAPVLGKIGLVQKDLGFYFEAQKYLEQALKLNFNLKKERRALAELYYNDGVQAVSLQDYAKGLEIFSKVIRLDPALKEARNNLAIVYYNLGSSDVSGGNFEEGIAKLQKALKYKSNYKEARLNIGAAYAQIAALLVNQGEYDKALEVFDTALKYKDTDDIKKNKALVYCKKAVAAQNQRETYKAAIGYYQQAITCCPDKGDNIVQNAKNNIKALEQRLKKKK